MFIDQLLAITSKKVSDDNSCKIADVFGKRPFNLFSV